MHLVILLCNDYRCTAKMKRVTFCLEQNTFIHVPAHCLSRRGTWVEDRLHFERRIARVGEILEPLLERR